MTKQPPLTTEQADEFQALALPIIQFLKDHAHPHALVIITPDSAGVVEAAHHFNGPDADQ